MAPQSRYGPPALILGDDPINVLGLARNLGRNGVSVHRVGATDSGMLHSRYIEVTRVVEGIDDFSDEEFVAALNGVGHEVGGTPVVFPTSDLHVLRIARNAARLSKSFLLLGSGLATTNTLVNKARFYQSLAKCGVAHPRSAFPWRRNAFEEAAEMIGYPVLLKPEISPLFYRRFNRKGLVAHDREELFRHLDMVEPSGLPLIVQEIIPGAANCMHGCAGLRTQEQFLVFCYRRVREYPGWLGCGSLLESVPSFVEQTGLLKYLDHIGYTGIFDAEFKRDPRDDLFKMIEINARSWWQNTHPSVSGANIVKAAYDHASGHAVDLGSYRVGTKWVHLYNDFFAARASGLGVLAWCLSLRGEIAFDICARDDLRPMLSFISAIVLRSLRAAPRLRTLHRDTPRTREWVAGK